VGETSTGMVQVSLLPSVAFSVKSPYRQCATNGLGTGC
jgi:hypothetical protein